MLAASSQLSLAASSVVFLIATTELHVADRAARHFARRARWIYFRGGLVAAALLGVLAAILYLAITRASLPLVAQAGAAMILLLGCGFALTIAAGRIDPSGKAYRSLLSLDEPNAELIAEKRGAQIMLVQGGKIAAAWLGVALFSSPLVAGVGAATGIFAAAILHRRVTHPLSSSIFYAGCAVSALSLSLHVLYG